MQVLIEFFFLICNALIKKLILVKSEVYNPPKLSDWTSLGDFVRAFCVTYQKKKGGN